ncbi:hypothetical protein GQ607_014762 [Colletotrichum asianum]|uniref:Uncharacterized protein n=1 Tax=Colletotrichum asianum TaxID=702518 RepID=A0A8H3ZJD5_9PEZI|nr:hypothetical protein GQ607_014762 [Colletotrichum asianum]
MNAALFTFLGAPDYSSVQSSVSQLLSDMGGASSRPPPPPRVAKTLSSTTVWVRHLPPIISENALQAIHSAIQLRNLYLAGDDASSGPRAVASLVEHLDGLADEAREAANVRDYVSLVIESTILSLMTDLGPPSKIQLGLARALNPFLNHPDEGAEAGPSSIDDEALPSPFRLSDVTLIDDPEKDLLVLLYYCDLVNLKASPDETVTQLTKMADKYGKIKDLDLRKELLTEIEIYIHWVMMYLTSNISAFAPLTALSASLTTKLEFEKGIQMSRLLTICEMLLQDSRSDQTCFLLMFLRRCAMNQEKTWWRSRAKAVLKGLKKTRVGRSTWHVEYAEKNLASLKRLEETGEERWSRRGSLTIDREQFELNKLKGD